MINHILIKVMLEVIIKINNFNKKMMNIEFFNFIYIYIYIYI